jgi:DNA-binding NarL/FixJ family response regulator
MDGSIVQVLVVDDFLPWRLIVASMLQEQPRLRIVGEAWDGWEAVQKARELQPELVLLDIGLPTLNGIEAARRIRELSPNSKIVFVSENRSSDIVAEVLRMGAAGYVVKADAGTELLPAVEAVLKGKQFVSTSVATQVLKRPADGDAADHPRFTDVEQPAPESSDIRRRHEVEFCPDDACFVDGFARFIETALRTGRAVIAIATESHRASLFQKLMANGIDVVGAVQQKNYIPLDVADTLETFMLNDWPDPVRFVKVARNLIMEAAKNPKGEGRHVAACGECAPSLLAKGKVEAAIQLEHLWDEIARSYNVDILCGYALNDFDMESNPIFQRICAEHSAVYSL